MCLFGGLTSLCFVSEAFVLLPCLFGGYDSFVRILCSPAPCVLSVVRIVWCGLLCVGELKVESAWRFTKEGVLGH